jgi:NAD(P)H-dependent FMN reductase
LKIEEASGVVICTPEYVFSLPGTLKNALDWTVSTTVFSDKPVAIITASSSGKKAHESLELVMKTLGAKIGQKSKLLIQGVRSKINSEGKISDEATWKEIKELCDSFVETMSMSHEMMAQGKRASF